MDERPGAPETAHDSMGGEGRLSPAGLQSLAAMNARVYAMTDQDREHWYAEHPVSDFVGPDEGPCS